MTPDRPERLTDRISELWNDRPRADRSPDRRADRLSFDQSADRPVADPPSDRLAAELPFADRPSDQDRKSVV